MTWVLRADPVARWPSRHPPDLGTGRRNGGNSAKLGHVPTGRTPEPGPLSLHVANVLASEIARRGLRQTDIAVQAGMSASQLSRVLAAKKVFTIDQLDAVCRAVGIPLVDVVVMPGQRSRRPRDRSHIPRIDVGPSRDTERAVAKAPPHDRGGDHGDG
ncbi:MAG: hypothetical protein K0S49_119 [Microbacterium sp.]|nr:hypothetical protein [Microbacterium sp.]